MRTASVKDITGHRQGRLVAQRLIGSRGQYTMWEFRCDCGALKVSHGSDFRRGRILSCGCLSRENTIARNTKHGMYRTTIYKIWVGMLGRCSPAFQGRRYYYDLGVRVCERWLTFENFLEDMGQRPSPSLSLDRWPDPFGNYEPGNVRWATATQQQQNRRDRVLR